MKYAWIDGHRDDFSVARMCRQLGVSRTGYCQWRTRPPSPRAQANAALDVPVAAIHSQYKRRYGRPRILRELREPVGQERVRKSLLRQGLRPVYRRPYRVTTDSDHRKPVAPNVLDRRFDGWQINQAWATDFVRHEAPLKRAKVQCLRPLAVAAAGEKLRAACARRCGRGRTAALTTPRRAGTARQPGGGKRDWKVYARNPCVKASQSTLRLEPGGSGPGSSAWADHRSAQLPNRIDVAGREATGKACGVPVAKLQEHNGTPPQTSVSW